MFKQVEIYTDRVDENIEALKSTMDENHIRYVIHDIKEKPLDQDKLQELLKHFNLEHFIVNNGNGSSKLISNLKSLPRSEIIEKLAEDNGMLRKPIIVAGRLTTVGFNWDSLMTMLYLKRGDSEESAENEKNKNKEN